MDSKLSVVDNKYYKIIFKNDKYTILPYSIIKNFGLIKNIINYCKENIITLQSMDMDMFMGVLCKMFHMSDFNLNKLMGILTKEEANVYNYLLSHHEIINIINIYKRDIMYIIDIVFKNRNYNNIKDQKDQKITYIPVGEIKNNFDCLNILKDNTKILSYHYSTYSKGVVISFTTLSCEDYYSNFNYNYYNNNYNDNIACLFVNKYKLLFKNTPTYTLDFTSTVGNKFEVFSGYHKKAECDIKINTSFHEENSNTYPQLYIIISKI
jgi:hypothetical protein